MKTIQLRIGTTNITLTSPAIKSLSALIDGRMKPFLYRGHKKRHAQLFVIVHKPVKGAPFNARDRSFLETYFDRIFSRPPHISNKKNRIKAAIGEFSLFAGHPAWDSLMSSARVSNDRWILADLRSGIMFFDSVSGNGTLFLRSDLPVASRRISLINAVTFLSSFLSPTEKALLIHGAGLVIGGNGYIFPGHSNSGKSTLAKLAGDRRTLSDDGIILGIDGMGCYMMSTPLMQGKISSRKRTSKKICLKNLYFPLKAKTTGVTAADKTEALAHLIAYHIHYFRYFDIRSSEKAFKTASGIVKNLDCGRLRFNKTPEFIKILTD